MFQRLATALAAIATTGFIAVESLAVQPEERNYWPLLVQRPADEQGVARWSSLGPFFFGSDHASGEKLRGFRPFHHHYESPDQSEATSLLYPLWYREVDAPQDRKRWTFFNLINSDSGSRQSDRFSVWPFYFSRETGDAPTSYRALFPFYGDISHRFGQDRLKWILFPLFTQYQNNDQVTTATPWPFIKTISGEGHQGFEFWPLLGQREETGKTKRQFWLWPLGYRSSKGLDTDEPTYRSGFLPFYSQQTSPGFRSQTFGWPFFGYVNRTSPETYRATHLFYPLWVQGRGETRTVNRWAPFYSHSRSAHQEKTWVMWPLWRDHQWQSNHLHHRRQQLVYFLFHEEVQRSLQSPDAEPAVKRHVWPLFSHWNNGAGRVQVQALSPVDVFFPHNERMRKLWSPLFALYRYDQTAPGEIRHAWLWDAVTFAASTERSRREFHLGPLFNFTQSPEGRRWGFLAGLLSVRQDGEGGLKASSRLKIFHRDASH
ncbi:MAG: hypothetical protein SynsKO_11280 [Synoicihabitans sp.]